MTERVHSGDFQKLLQKPNGHERQAVQNQAVGGRRPVRLSLLCPASCPSQKRPEDFFSSRMRHIPDIRHVVLADMPHIKSSNGSLRKWNEDNKWQSRPGDTRIVLAHQFVLSLPSFPSVGNGCTHTHTHVSQHHGKSPRFWHSLVIGTARPSLSNIAHNPQAMLS